MANILLHRVLAAFLVACALTACSKKSVSSPSTEPEALSAQEASSPQCTDQSIKATATDRTMSRTERREILNQGCIGTFVTVTGKITAVRADSGIRLGTLVDEAGARWEMPATQDMGEEAIFTGAFLWAARNGTYLLGNISEAESIKRDCSDYSEAVESTRRICRVVEFESSQDAIASSTTGTQPSVRYGLTPEQNFREKLRRDACREISRQVRSGRLREAGESAEIAMAMGIRCNPHEL